MSPADGGAAFPAPEVAAPVPAATARAFSVEGRIKAALWALVEAHRADNSAGVSCAALGRALRCSPERARRIASPEYPKVNLRAGQVPLLPAVARAVVLAEIAAADAGRGATPEVACAVGAARAGESAGTIGWALANGKVEPHERGPIRACMLAEIAQAQAVLRALDEADARDGAAR